MDLTTDQQFPELELGDTIYLTGEMFTSRDKATKKALGEKARYSDNPVIYHCGPVMKKNEGKWKVISAGPTTSSRMNANTPEFIRKYKPKAIIGKGGMSKKCYEAMQENGCVYLLFTGGCGALAAEGITETIGVDWFELGMPEAVWGLKIEKFGPLIVAAKDGKSIWK